MDRQIIEKLQIDGKKSILDAIRIFPEITEISRIILFVCDEEGSVVGSLTDGDVRRSLINNGFHNLAIDKICNYNFDYIRNTVRYRNFDDYRAKNIKILPVLDEANRLVDIIDIDQTKAILPLECMIMAGGRGKRLSPLTDIVPKPMLMLGGKPIIQYNIERLISYGIRKIYISVKYLAEQIVTYFGDGHQWGIDIEYVNEDEPLGTAGALSLAPGFTTDYVLLMNSDLFTNVDLEALYSRAVATTAEIAIASMEYKVDIPFAVFETESDRVIRFKEKPSLSYPSNAGIYLLKKELIDRIPQNTFYNITDLMDDVITNGGKIVYDPILGYWIDIGRPSDYEQAQKLVEHLK